MTFSLTVLLTAGTLLLVSRWTYRVVEAQLNEVPPCLNEVAAACVQNALASLEPSACNWYVIMPVLYQCVDEATSGCNTRQINDWLQIVAQFNATMNSGNCTSTCPDPVKSKTEMDQCYVFDRTVDGKQYTSLDAVINDIIQSPSPSNPACSLLTDVIDCLTTATDGCTALMDVTEQNMASLNANNATSSCNVAMFVGPTTSAPLAIFQTITFPTTTTTTQPRAAVILGDNSQETATWASLIVIGGVVCIAVVVAVVVLLKRTAFYRKRAKYYDELHRSQEIEDRNESVVRDALRRQRPKLQIAGQRRAGAAYIVP